MLTKNDIATIRGVVLELFVENNNVWDKKLDETLDVRFLELKRDILDQTRALLVQTEKRIITEVTECIGEEILPQLDEHTRQIGILHHLRLA